MAAKKRTALNLAPREKKAVREFITLARSAYGDQIRRVALFGSKVRGDWKKYSDIDILLIVEDDSWKFREPIWRIAAGIDLKYDLLLDIRIISAERWQYYADIKAGLYQNIIRDAVPIRLRKIKSSALAGAG